MDSTRATDRCRNPPRHALALSAALVFLNAVLNLDAAIPGRPWESFLQLSPEFLVLAVGMSLPGPRGVRFRPALYAPIAGAVIFIGLFRLADTLVPLVFNRPFNLYLDTLRFPDVVQLGRALLSPVVFVVVLAAFALALPGMAWGVLRCLKIMHTGLAAAGRKSVLSCLAAGVIAAGA
jgi:hypothetical protein